MGRLCNFSIDDKLICKTTYPDFKLEDVFPWTSQLSEGIDKDAFLKSFFCQPDLFIRVRNGYDHLVKAELTKPGCF
jgi:16S rRNA (cytosine967-C5)-methyltransferase